MRHSLKPAFPMMGRVIADEAQRPVVGDGCHSLDQPPLGRLRVARDDQLADCRRLNSISCRIDQ